MVVHNHTKVCDKWFSGSEDLVQTNIHVYELLCSRSQRNFKMSILKFRCDREHSNPFFSQDTPAYWISSSKKCSTNSHVLTITALAVISTLWFIVIYHYTKFGYKSSSGSRVIVRTKSGHTDRWTHRYKNAVISIYPPPSPPPTPLRVRGSGVVIKKKNTLAYFPQTFSLLLSL